MLTSSRRTGDAQVSFSYADEGGPREYMSKGPDSNGHREVASIVEPALRGSFNETQ